MTPPGYKQTEVGVIPMEWETVAVGNLVESNAPICYGVVQVGQHTESGVPIVAIKFVKEIAYAPLHRTAISLEKPYARSRPRAGDVLISIKGTIGRVGIVPPGFQGNISRELARLCISQDTCSEYIAHQLEAGATQERIMRSVVGTTRLEFSIAALRQFQLPVPPSLPEQVAIATALGDMDALLAALDRLIAKQRDLKQAAMQQLLTGHTRLPGFHEEWDQVSLGELFAFKNGLNKAKEFFGFGTPIVNYMDVFENSGILCSTLQGRVSLTNPEIKNFDVRRGDVLFTRTSETPDEIGMASVILDDPDQTVFSGFVLRGRPRNEMLCDAFKAYCFRSSFVRRQIVSKASYTTRALTNGRILSAVTLPVPSVPEQTAIAGVLSDMDAELSALEQRRDKTRALKQGMMQELLTGRTRLV